MTALARRFESTVGKLAKTSSPPEPLQIQLRAGGPMMGTIVPVESSPDAGDTLYEITVEAMMGNQKLSLTMTFAGADVLWYAGAPKPAERPLVVPASSLHIGGAGRS